jgi:hypothetical protein
MTILATARTRRDANLITPWLVAAAGFAFDVIAWWPGQMSFDSAYAWWQARGGDTTDIVPPVFVLVWRVCTALLPGPGLMFALHLALFWGGLALIFRALRARSPACIAGMVYTALTPLPLLMRGHLWTDVALAAALLFATGTLASARSDHRWPWLAVTLPVLLYATALRHNALPAVLPFALWWTWLAWPRRDAPVRRQTVPIAGACALALALFGGATAIDRIVDRQVPVWTSLAQWDLAAVSISTNRMLLPDFMIGPGLDIPELAAAFRPWSNTPMLANTQHGMRDPFMRAYTDAQLSTLRAAWLAAIVDEPRAWLVHRLRLAQALFGTHTDDMPRELTYSDQQAAYRDNMPIAANDGALHRLLLRGAERLRTTFVLAAWPYLAVGAWAALFAWRQRRERTVTIPAVLLASAWLYAAPFIALAPSAELRYLTWPCVASLLAAACLPLLPPSATR